MGTNSADPQALDLFVGRTREANARIASEKARLSAAQAAFTGANRYGGFDATSLVNGLSRYDRENAEESDRVAAVAAAFRAAGGAGAMRRLPDAAIEASLRSSGATGRRDQVTVDGAEFHGVPSTTGYANDPVNTASGGFVHVETDVALPGLASGLTFLRTYNSRSSEDGAFGRGWSAWTEARLLPRPDGAHYVGPDGQRVVFPREGEGYGRVADVRGRVVVAGDELVLDWFSGPTWTFDATGLPRRTDSGPGTVVDLRHEGGRLVELEHAGGRWLRLSWEGDRVTGLTSSDGRAVRYDRDGAGDSRRGPGDPPGRGATGSTRTIGVGVAHRRRRRARAGQRVRRAGSGAGADVVVRPSDRVLLPPRRHHRHRRRDGGGRQHLAVRRQGPPPSALVDAHGARSVDRSRRLGGTPSW